MAHIHVVVRLDFQPGDPLVTIPTDPKRWSTISAGRRLPAEITTTKAYRDAEEAWAEADRLNELNGAKGCRYFVRLARLQA